MMKVQKTLKKTVILFYKTVLNWFYVFLTILRQPDENKVVIVLSRLKTLDGNIKYVYDELKTQQPAVKIHLLHTTNKMNLQAFRDMLVLANATYLIVDDYYLPIYLIKPKGKLKVIQLWHAAGAFKKFGLSTMNTKFGPSSSYIKLVPVHSNYTHVYVSSSRVVPYYAEAFNMSAEQIFPYGTPRIDLFADEKAIKEVKERIKSEFPRIQKNKHVYILVAPTYRASGNHRESHLNFIDVIIQASKQVEDHIQIIFKEHPYVEEEELRRLQQCKNMILSPNYSVNEWMLIADALVTDYSSAIFDFSILKKPFAHFVPDIHEYTKSRGLYEDIRQISDGDIIMEMETLIHWMNARKKNEHYDTTRMIAYNFDNTKDVSRRVVSHFREN